MIFLFLATASIFVQSIYAQKCPSSTIYYPNITTAWGTYQAWDCDDNGSFFVWRNIRFGKAPVGGLRFNKSQFPNAISNNQTQQKETGAACYQIETDVSDCPGASPDKDGQHLGGPFLRNPSYYVSQSEDCLFLDIYAPISAVNSAMADVSVVVWFYGGAYLFGSKDQGLEDVDDPLPLYNGTGLMRAAANASGSVIFVTGNYRVGAFGWLGGYSMERFAAQNLAVPNAGLYDQRLVLKFVNMYIDQVRGNKTNVSAWGESAGGGSILHHLVANWTAVGDAPLTFFSQVMVQSPAYQWQWDRSPAGVPDQAYRNLTNLANCTYGDITCLQKVDGSVMANLSQALYEERKCTGTYSVGPVVDGNLIRQLPPISFLDGTSFPSLKSFIASHVANESLSFVPAYITSSSGFDTFLNYMIPGTAYSTARAQVASQYASIQDQRQRAIQVIQDSTFTCNTRQLFEAFTPRPWVSRYMMSYNLGDDIPPPVGPLSVHGSDLAPTFWNSDVNITEILLQKYPKLDPTLIEEIAEAFPGYSVDYQTYLVSHAMYSNPNAYWVPPGTWLVASGGEMIGNVLATTLDTDTGFDNISDPLNTASTCLFWSKLSTVLDAGGNTDNKSKGVDDDYWMDLSELI